MNEFEKHIKKSEHPENYYNPRPLTHDGCLPLSGRPWQILRPIVYRYMEEKFIDSFLETGKIRLSTLKSFSSAEGEARKDGSEMFTMGHQNGKNFKGQMGGVIADDNYVFCTSLICHQSIANEFQTGNHVLMIKDTMRFADLISCHIKDFHSAIEGVCIYQEDIALRRSDDNDELSKLYKQFHDSSDSKKEKILEKIAKLSTQNHFGMDIYFVKPLRYAKQMEYRMVWFIDSRTDNKYLEIQIPKELVNQVNQICEKRKLI